jgi:hypothetical protein
MYQVVRGDVDLVAHVVGIGDGHPLAETGVMIRGSLSSDASHESLTASRTSGVAFERRLARGWSTLGTATTQAAQGAWLRLERRGAVVSAFVSTNGSAWQMVGSELVNLDAAAYVGVVVASHRPTALVTAVVDHVSLRSVGSDAVDSDSVHSDSADSDSDEPETPSSSISEDDKAPTVTEPPRRGAPPPLPEVPSAADAPVAPAPAAPPGENPPAPSWPSTSVEPVVPVPVEPVVPIAPAPVTQRHLAFGPSSDHDSNVEAYTLEIQLVSNPGVSVASVSLGKPAVSNGECFVEVSYVLNGLPAGTYVALVRATNAFGASAAAVSAPFSL